MKLLKEGEFSEKTLQKLVTKLSSDFEPYKPVSVNKVSG